MSDNQLQPRESLNKAFLKVKPDRSTMENFRANLLMLLDRINEAESEEFHKNLVADFLKNTYYSPSYFINTKERNDLVIHNGKDAKSPVGVILEAKKPRNKQEMLKVNNLNTKAFQELVLYFLRERITKGNLEIKYLVATNVYEWFVFDAREFDEFFVGNKDLVKQFQDFEKGGLSITKTDAFYREIAKPVIANIEQEIKFTYFDLRDYREDLSSLEENNSQKLIDLYKIFAPEHLLKLPFANDSNTLNKPFYNELLHIIGLTEIKVGGKKLIGRKQEGDRDSGSLIENAISRLDSLDKMAQLRNPEEFGETKEEKLFNIALRLSITWINRILFLKLLEAQLIKYHRGDQDFAFLNLAKVKSYGDLNSLFFEVLACEQSRRDGELKKVFAKVPYLNSSLFELTDIEQQTIVVSNLRDRNLLIFGASVLKDSQGKRRSGELNALAYLFEFLSAYNFSSDELESGEEDSEKLINAAVLGLIFEKINGYKDGSFYTPSFITMYMCRETIRRAVVQKFNEMKGWNCQNIQDLKEDLSNYIKNSSNRSDCRKEANNIVNKIKICDPAVGSGHFLVSALNEMIAIKQYLGILQDRNGEVLSQYEIEVINDKLRVTLDNKLFAYNPENKKSQEVQEALFYEKQTIIENCLFGVDINPNSVTICRLRLWIELLKNAYYKENGELETLPNIDINIKCGNSLISRFELGADLGQALKTRGHSIESYQAAVQTYRNAESKDQKREMERLINEIKGNFRVTLQVGDPNKIKLRGLEGELHKLEDQILLFEETKAEQKVREKKVNKLQNEIEKIRANIEDIESGKVYENALEWRFEFPEVLNDEGDFVGFDVVIGNPPYGVFPSKSEMAILLNKYEMLGINNSLKDSYFIFCILGLKDILKSNGYLCYIIPNTWKLIDTAQQFRQSLISEFNFLCIDEFKTKIFDEATVDCDIIFVHKSKLVEYDIQIQLRNSDVVDHTNILSNNTLLEQQFFNFSLKQNELLLLNKIKSQSFFIKDHFEIKNGVKPYEIGKGFPAQTKKILQEKPYTSETKLNETFKPLIGGRYFNKYVILWNNDFWISYGKWLAAPRKESIFKAEEKLIIRQTSDRIIGTLITDGFIMRDNTHIILKKNEEFNLKYLLSILNSKLIDFVYTSINPEKNEALAQVKVFHLEVLPFYPLSTKYQVPFIHIVDQILATKKSDPNADTTTLEKEIDRLVYKLYQLTYEEVKIIDPEFELTEPEYTAIQME